eukprot:scaffold75125_cov72-Phaeocystis_antarctica.AAC.1
MACGRASLACGLSEWGIGARHKHSGARIQIYRTGEGYCSASGVRKAVIGTTANGLRELRGEFCREKP